MATTTAHDPRTADELRRRMLAAVPMTERSVRLAGVTTAVVEGGEGPPIVLLHGQGEFWGVWLRVLDDLMRTHRVIVVDLPGHGASLEIAGALDADTMVRWVDELLDETCDEPPVLVGHLLGGAIAARYAVTHGRRLAHLVLVDALGLNWFRPSPRFALPMVAFLARPTPASRDRLFDRCFVDFDRVGDGFGDLWDVLRDYALDRARTPENQAALRALMPRVGVPPIPRDELDRIDAPTTLIHGRDDLQVPLKAARRASERHGWPLHVIDGARDDPAAEEPQAFLDALRSAIEHPHDRPHDRRPREERA
ncbi:MAG: alpha/beta hydrolase [Actinobacteria bacterium]|nr:alpha/beta hydrolase [Actinomycetota bacterium]